jgi:hypothetical protein
MVTEKYQFPKITPIMHKEMQEWYQTHNGGKCVSARHGAIGGNISFVITPTSIGDFVTVQCTCGAELSLIEP